MLFFAAVFVGYIHNTCKNVSECQWPHRSNPFKSSSRHSEGSIHLHVLMLPHLSDERDEQCMLLNVKIMLSHPMIILHWVRVIR